MRKTVKRKKQSNITYPQMMAINRHRDTVVETHTHTHSPYQIPNVMKTTENLHFPDVFEGMPVFSHEDDESSLCPSVYHPHVAIYPSSFTHQQTLTFSPSSLSKLSSLPLLLLPCLLKVTWVRMHAHARVCVCTSGSVWETPLGKWWAKKNSLCSCS